MKLKVQGLMDATLTLATIINERRSLPQKGKYRIARMHAKMLPEFKVIDARRDAMIMEMGNPQMKSEVDAEGNVTLTTIEGQWQVPPDKMPEFTEAWKAIGEEEIDVDVQPIPLSQLILNDQTDGAIEANELIILGDLVSDA